MLVINSSPPQDRQTLSSMTLRSRQDHGLLMSKIIDNRTSLRKVHDVVETIENKMEGIEAACETKFSTMVTKFDAAYTSLISLKYVGEQILAFISTFTLEIRGLLHTITQTDWRTYQAVLQIQQCLARSPTCYHESNIRFTDALGDYKELPYEFFCHWEVCQSNTTKLSIAFAPPDNSSLAIRRFSPQSIQEQAWRKENIGWSFSHH